MQKNAKKNIVAGVVVVVVDVVDVVVVVVVVASPFMIISALDTASPSTIKKRHSCGKMVLSLEMLCMLIDGYSSEKD